jgi:alpha-ketoglutarate-dependent taurine dioxygenase
MSNTDAATPLGRGSWADRRKSIKPTAIDLVPENLVRTDYLRPGQTLPLVVEPNVEGVDPADWTALNRDFIDTRLLRHGALLFRGFGVRTQIDFTRFLNAATSQLMRYTEGATPRTELADKVYTSTEYPADQHIALHNELTYVTTWPGRIWFCCLQPAEQRGETPIADVRKVLQRLDPPLVERFRRKQWMLVRNFGEGMSLPWQTSFHTTDRREVERYCESAAIECEWKPNDSLRTRQVRPALARHSHTGEMVWFNHVAFWHISSLERHVREGMLAAFKQEDLPYNTYYGDGSPIEDSVVEEIREAYRRETIEFSWQAGDVLMADNMLVAHGRNPFVGERRVLTAMGEPCSDRGLGD